jgi:hypothetical protein
MTIALPTDPDGDQFEDLIVSALLTLGYFVESNMILSQEGKEILELDVVATPIAMGSDARVLFEVKKEKFSFSNIFKLYGQKIYLGIHHACLVSMQETLGDQLVVFSAKGNELGINMRSFPLSGGSYTLLHEQKNSLSEKEIASITKAVWYQNIARRVALSHLRRECKGNRGVAAYENARNYLFASRASFFQKEALARAETLYKAYLDNPKLSESLVIQIAQTRRIEQGDVWKRVRDNHEQLDVQCVMDLESMARFTIVKNALDDAFERGENPPPSFSVEFGEASIDLPRHNLPDKYFRGLQRMKGHQYGANIPYLFEAFYIIFGGFLFVDMPDELELLSRLTNIPSEKIIECIGFMNDFFGEFFFSNKKYGMLCMKGVPGIVRGGGSFVRQNIFGFTDYKEKYGDASWLLAKWHNAAYYALEPYLKKI